MSVECCAPGGRSLIQMANMFGVRRLNHQARRGFRAARGFEVRYWSSGEPKETFARLIGPTDFSIDGFFLDPQLSDLRFAPLVQGNCLCFGDPAPSGHGRPGS